MNNIFIYELSYIENNIPFYIGKSKRLNNRKYFHTKKYGKNISIIIIDQVPENEWKFWEKYYIQQYKQWGFELKNINEGGGGPSYWTKDQKEKHSIKFKNNNHSQYYTQEIREKMSKSLIGIKKPGTSKALKGKPSNNQNKTNPNGGSKKGWKHSEEHNIKISKGMKKQWENNSKLKNRILPTSHPSQRKYILQYDLNGNFIQEWKGLGFAAKQLGINKRGICNCCLGISKNSGGYIWKYK